MEAWTLGGGKPSKIFPSEKHQYNEAPTKVFHSNAEENDFAKNFIPPFNALRISLVWGIRSYQSPNSSEEVII